MTDNEVVIAKSRGIAFQVEVLTNRHLALAVPLYIHNKPSGTRTKVHNVIDYTPHLWIHKSIGLAEHSSRVLPAHSNAPLSRDMLKVVSVGLIVHHPFEVVETVEGSVENWDR